MNGSRRSDPLRILLAYDLSPAAERAVALLAGVTWPPGTVVRVATSPVGVGSGSSSFALLSERRAHARETTSTIASAHERIGADLRAAGVSVETAVIHGKPERVVVAAAAGWAADLIVVGARDQSPLGATLLGSVSRSIVDRATCSVLIARDPAVSRVVLATDGSRPATLAARFVGTWPMFERARILVVTVGDAPSRYGVMDLDEPMDTARARQSTDPSRNAAGLATDVARDLAERGRSVEIDARSGDPATEVVAAAELWAADLVVIGAHSEPLARRLILGSMARKVIDGARWSVLVARARMPSP